MVLLTVEWVYSEFLYWEELGQMVASVEMGFQVDSVAYLASLRVDQDSSMACLVIG